jgi:uncharacterized protein YfaS (alpha-2-macroglobulin family)
MKRSAAWVAAGLVVVGCVSLAAFTSYSLAQSRENGQVLATYVHGVLDVVIPYSAPRNGAGDLTVEVLDPEDHVVGGVNTPVYARAGRGLPQQSIAMRDRPAVDDLVWHRLRYRFAYADDRSPVLEGIVSISQVLRRPVVHVLDQQKYVSGGAAAVRLIATEKDNETPIKSGSLRIEMQGPGKKTQTLYAGSLNERGTTRAEFRFPAGLAGRVGLRYVADTPLGTAEFIRQVELEEKASILLTTEKPVYQPGQTMHVRALALDQSSHRATGGRALTFEVEDSRGNKVFRKITRTDEYGIASAEFALADEVNLGTYHLRALMDENAAAPQNAAASPSKAEIALEVQKYVLPRFKVDLDLAGKDAKAKRGYRPGDHVTGTVRSNYFFGKPVDHADVVVKATGRDVASFEAGQVKGTTDTEGAFRFDIRLPEFFAGHPMAQGAAVVTIEATVKDGAGHSETHGDAVTVSESPLLITAIPEGGALAAGLNNELFILASYPDGTPARAQIRVHTDFGEESAETDQSGVATVQVLGPGKTEQVRIEAKDSEGNRASVPVSLASRTGADQILVHADKALYRAGDRMRLQVWSTKERGNAYVDVVKDGQTIATHDLDIVHGRADLDITATAQMAGTVEFHGYVFGRDGRATGDRRLVFVQPADELKIETTVDAPVYRPGGEARVGFHVTNNRGEGVQAALGLEVVDQAVFAMAEKQPGFAKVFFYLEQELMKPRYEIHSIGLPEAISAVNPGGQGQSSEAQRDRAARALFSAMEVKEPNNSSLDYGREALQTKLAAYKERYQKRVAAQVEQRVDAVYGGAEKGNDTCNREWPADQIPVDPWGHRLQVQRTYGAALVVRSAGPDGQLYNDDDLLMNVANPWCSAGGSIRITRARGTVNGTASLTGTVRDSADGVIPGATITLINAATGAKYSIKTDARGKFSLDGLHKGDYLIETSSMGFRKAVRRFPLRDADNAVADVRLEVGAMADTIVVTAEAALLKNESRAFGAVAFAMPAALPQMMALPVNARMAPGTIAKIAPAAEEAHVRSWFPESLYVAPEIITDRDGRASITIPIADNITTWRMAMLASTKQGALGSGTSSLKVFQDFFTEMDLPVTLTQGDEVSIPVAIYNYAGSRGNVVLRLEPGDWFAADGDSLEKVVPVESGRVGAAQFSVAAKRIGKFKLTLKAEMDGAAKRADIVVREVEVVPNGREQTIVFNGRLDAVAQHTVSFPANAIPESGTVFVRLYPGPLSQVVEGMDSLLRMPYGCFEQTSSSTYPNVLALDYMKRTKKLTPEIHTKAEGFIASGYQRLLTFEVQGGGFSWFGNAPANKILTSYGLMEFSDMAKVHDVDERVIRRTQQWLVTQQQPDGSWRPDASFINEGATNRYNSDTLRITTYIAWALEATGYQGAAVDSAKRYIESHLPAAAKPDPYTLAVLANFASGYTKDPGFVAQATRLLLDARTEQGDQVWWKSEETGMFATGASAAIETTGLAVQALLKQGGENAIVAKAMNYIVAKKDAAGTWGSTQATIMALRAMLLAAEKGGATAKGAVEVLLNGKVAGRVALTAENNDLLHQFAFKDVDARAANRVEVRFDGEGSLAYQVAGRYFTPWNAKPGGEPLSIDVSYDRTRLAQDQIATATATVRNDLATTANMVMVDLGIPPGFDLLSEDLQDYRVKSAGQKSGRLEKYSLTPTQAVLYFDSIAARSEFKLSFRLRAKYPIRTRTFESRVYEYYSPDVYSVAQPVQMEVRR